MCGSRAESLDLPVVPLQPSEGSFWTLSWNLVMGSSEVICRRHLRRNTSSPARAKPRRAGYPDGRDDAPQVTNSNAPIFGEKPSHLSQENGFHIRKFILSAFENPLLVSEIRWDRLPGRCPFRPAGNGLRFFRSRVISRPPLILAPPSPPSPHLVP